MILVTGAAGFIGSCLVRGLNEYGLNDLIISDDFSNEEKNKNLEGKKFQEKVDRNLLLDGWLINNGSKITFIFHIGARTDTAEFDYRILNALNLEYTKALWNFATENQIPFVYASSAATYGLGEFGYEDDETKIDLLKPLNPYGESKNEFDKWAIRQHRTPPYWVGLKFFNVYGPNEFHKGRMASVIFHAYHQLKEKGEVKLFRSHNPDFKDGEQLRDFIYVKDVIKVCLFLYKTKIKNGIYNLGSGKARTFLDLAKNTFYASGVEPNIEFMDTPKDIRDKYQYFTEAKMDKLTQQGYSDPFYSLEEGVEDYVKNYLSERKYY